MYLVEVESKPVLQTERSLFGTADYLLIRPFGFVFGLDSVFSFFVRCSLNLYQTCLQLMLAQGLAFPFLLLISDNANVVHWLFVFTTRL